MEPKTEPLESVALPAGVELAQWQEEKARWQNPRIRTLLGCANILEAASESNQAILTCTPERLEEIWTSVRQVTHVVCDEVMPLLEGPSVMPKLEEARQRARAGAAILYSTVIREIESMPEHVEEARRKDFRRLLCVSMGQLDDFLQDAFAELMANDPRSFHDSGYFLSRRFRRDVEEAEWLLETVDSLIGRIEALEERRRLELNPAALQWAGEGSRDGASPGPAAAFLRDLAEQLTPLLKEVVALRGIRFAELEVVDRWASELPIRCHVVLELWSVAGLADLEHDGAITTRGARAILLRARELVGELDGLLKDLRAFLPVWRSGLVHRRALAFRRGDGEPAARSRDVADP
jgi:hypothetical protein